MEPPPQGAGFGGYQQHDPNNPLSIPGYEKLTRSERNLMNALQGVAENPVGSWILDKLGTGWVGKALGVLDVGAENLERFAGFGAQALSAFANPAERDFYENLGAAWYAGGLSADMMNLPQWTEEGVEPASPEVEALLRQANVPGQEVLGPVGTRKRLVVPQDLPGVAGLVGARQRITQLVAGGMTYHDALIQTREEYYQDIGALAFRAQLYDAFVHIAGDPLNYILPRLKPFERIRLAREYLAFNRAVPEAAELAARGLDEAQTALKLTEEAGDAAKIAEATAEVARFEGAVETAQVTKQLGPWEERFLRVTGGIPGVETKLPKALDILATPFKLTPRARASEFVVQILNNVSSYVLAKSQDPIEIIRAITRSTDGAMGREFGHMVVTYEGRQVMGVLKAFKAYGDDLLIAYQKTASFEQPMLTLAAQLLGETPASLMQRIKVGEALAITNQIADKLQQFPDAQKLLAPLLAQGGYQALGPEVIQRLGSVFGDTVLYSPEGFRAELLNKLVDVAAQQAIIAYGVSAKGPLLQFTDAIKAAETLAFLKTNPSYPIRNAFNNFATMIARGSFGMSPADELAKVWTRIGIEPARLRSGVGMAGELGAELTQDALSRGMRLLADAEKGKVPWLQNITEWIGGQKGFGMGQAAQHMEQSASFRSFTTGYLRGNRHFWVDTVKDQIRAWDPRLLESLGPDETAAIIGKVQDALSDKELDAIFFSDNLNINWGQAVAQAEDRLGGAKIWHVIDDEFEQVARAELLEAAARGPDALLTAKESLVGRMNQVLDERLDAAVQNMIDEAQALTETEKIGAYPKIWTAITDEFWGGMQKTISENAEMAELARRATDPQAASVIWQQLRAQSGSFWERTWTRVEARLEGFSRGAKAINLPNSDALTGTFREWRRGWKDYFNFKSKAWDNYWEALIAGETPRRTAEEIVLELDQRYGKMIELEGEYMGRMDQSVASMLPAEQRGAYLQWRASVANMRQADKEAVRAFYQQLQGMTKEERYAAFAAENQRRAARLSLIWDEENRGLAAMAGNAQAGAPYQQAAQQATEALNAEYDVLNKRLWDAATPKAAHDAIKARMADIDDKLRPVPGMVAGPTTQHAALPNFHTVVPRQLYMSTGVDELWYTRGREVFDALSDSLEVLARKKPLRFGNMTPDVQNMLRANIEGLKGKMADARFASTRFGEYVRDSALLNYSRRFNYNTWLGAIFPYEFWFTQSVMKWALHSLDRPAMLSTYLRTRRFLDSAYGPNEERLPTRLRGRIKIPLPFLPDWLGDGVFVDPLRAVLPFDSWNQPFEQFASQTMRDQGAAERVLRELVNDGKITQQDYNLALTTRTGPAWERAMVLARQDDAEGRLNGFDFMSLFTSPHAPLLWAYNLARGEPERIGPILPFSRTVAGVQGLLGIPPSEGLNSVGAAIRKSLGLPAFDQWEDYRVDRMLANMAATGDISSTEARRAMIERNGEAFEEAQRRAAIEYGVSAMGSTLAIPAAAYPPGEERMRELAVEYQGAWKAYEDGDDDAVKQFYDQHPEYEARLALYDSPDERMRTFLADELWNAWNNLPQLHRDEVKAQLGPEFVYGFLNPETRSTANVPVDTMGVWLKFMGGDPPGSMTVRGGLPPLTSPEVANRVQVFYDIREQRMDYNDTLWPLQHDYFQLQEGQARKDFLRAHPKLQQYWNWRRDFMYRNPDLAPYLEDDPARYPKYKSEAELRAVQAAQPNYTAQEWQTLLGGAVYRLARDTEPLPQAVLQRLETVAKELGLSIEQLQSLLQD